MKVAPKFRQLIIRTAVDNSLLGQLSTAELNRVVAHNMVQALATEIIEQLPLPSRRGAVWPERDSTVFEQSLVIMPQAEFLIWRETIADLISPSK